MQVVTIGSLLESAAACSSSSDFVSDSSSAQHMISPGVHQPILESDVVPPISGKRCRDEQELQTSTSFKKVRANCRTINVLPQRWTIVGRLQLCNQSLHSRNGLYVPADCVALTDLTATICCCICQGPDPGLLGKLVRVNSWSFIPKKEILNLTSATNAGDLCIEPLTIEGSAKTSIVQAVPNCPGAPVNPARMPSIGSEKSDGKLGVLEIHSLELLEVQPEEQTTLPSSLFVNPAAVDSRKAVVGSPLTRQAGKAKGLTLRGLLRSISPPFILPCKIPLDPNASRSRAGPSRLPDTGEQSNGRLSQEPNVGFFVKIHFCPSCSATYIDSGKQLVQRGRHRLREREERELGSGLSEDCPAVSLKVGHCVTTTVGHSVSGLSQPAVSARTLSSAKPFEPAGLSHVYFSGSVAAWRPVLSGALGRCVTVSGLKKKLILVGSEKRPYIIYLATRKSLVTLDRGRELLGGRLTSHLNMPGARDLARTYPLVEPKVGSDPVILSRGNVRIDVDNCQEKKLKVGVEFGSTFDPLCVVEQSNDAPPGCGQEDAHVCMEGGKGAGMNTTVISFVGFVTDILFQGTLVELDGRVWLLLTHQRHTQLHGLRIGAMLSLRDTHAITIKDLTGKSLLLGACMHSHVSVVLFSPLCTQSWIQVHSRSLLLKHIQHLSFISTFWLLSLIGSFRQKFRDIYSNKELLGTKKDPGIIQKYAGKAMAPDVTLDRDVFKEYFHHQSCRLGDKRMFISIMQVPPISNFCEHIEGLWQSPRSITWLSKREAFVDCQRKWTNRRSPVSLSSASGQSVRLIITSEELGMILLGSLQVINLYLEYTSCGYGGLFYAKVCQTSGKLQLVDATGMVDVMIPDLSSSEHLSRTYQVSCFTVVVEGLGEASPPARKGIDASLISWSSLLKEVKAKPRFPEFVKYCVHFYIRDAAHLRDLDWCDNLVHEVGLPCHDKNNNSLQKQMQERWAETRLHLDSLKVWFQLQAVEVPDVCSIGHGVDILCECVGPLADSDRLFRISCKVVAVRLMMFEWQGGPAVSEQSWINSSMINWKSQSGIPLTLACFVVDDGSGPVDCWALGDAAVSLLGIVKMATQLKLPAAMLERICLDLGIVTDSQSFINLSPEQILCYMVQRYGQIILQNESACGDSVVSQYLIRGSGGTSLNSDEQVFLWAVVTSACHNGPLVVVGGNIPPMGTVCSAVCRMATCPCKVHSGSRRFRRDPSLDHSRPQLFAHRVESVLCLTDLKKITQQVATLLGNKCSDVR